MDSAAGCGSQDRDAEFLIGLPVQIKIDRILVDEPSLR